MVHRMRHRILLGEAALCTSATMLLLCGSAGAAEMPTAEVASTTAIHIAPTTLGGVNLRRTPDTSLPPVGFVPAGASPSYHCYEQGQPINADDVWFSVTYGGVTGFYSSEFDDSRFGSPAEIATKYGIPECSRSAAATDQVLPSPQGYGPAPAPEPLEQTSNGDTAWRMTTCVASLGANLVVAVKLIRVLRAGSSILELARLLANGKITVEAIESVTGGILGTQAVIDNCLPLTGAP
jgi:uncharacterized protein YraI